MNICYIYCRDVSAGDSEFYSLPVVRMAKILRGTGISLHVVAIGDFDSDTLKKHDVSMHSYDRWVPQLGLVSFYIQLFAVALSVGYTEEIDGFSNIWAQYNLLPVILASAVLNTSVFARVFGLGNAWNRTDAFDAFGDADARETALRLVKRLLNLYEAFLLNRTDGVYTNAEAVRNLLSDLGTDSVQFTVLSQGVDTDFFTPGNDDRERTVLFAGRVGSDNKRFGDAYEAFSLVTESIDNVTFAVAGENDLPANYRRVVEQSDDIRWLGYLNRESLRSQYQSASVLLLTSAKEGVPNVILEAQACGLPVVATAAGDVQRLLNQSNGGVIKSVGDVEGMADAIKGLLYDDSRVCRMSASGREFVVEYHSFKSLRNRYVSLFNGA